ncbi:hypothetical protein ACQX3D_11280, partial [Corynebacterium diphtheriae]
RQITLKAHEEIMASQEVGHSTWFRSCIPIISVKKPLNSPEKWITLFLSIRAITNMLTPQARDW